MRKKAVLHSICIFLFLGLFQCIPPGPPAPLIPQAVDGIVVESLGGSAVAGSLVTIAGTALSTVSDAAGRFNFDEVMPGTYDFVFSKSGMAGSKMQAVDVVSGAATDLEIIQTVYDFSDTLTAPPTIQVSGIEKGAVYYSPIVINVQVVPGSVLTPIIGTRHGSIFLKLDSPAGYIIDGWSRTDILDYTWDPRLFPPGNFRIKIIAYDNNNNRSELTLPVTVGSQNGAAPGSAPATSAVEIIAVTNGKSNGYFSIKAPPWALEEKDSGENALSGIPADTVIESAQPDSTVYVYFRAKKTAGTTGLRVFRSASADGTFILVRSSIYSLVVTDEYGEFSHYAYYLYDFSACLIPGETVYYKLAYFNGYGQGPLSQAYSVRILPKFNLYLTAPGDNTVVTSSTPLLQWTSEIIPGASRCDIVDLFDLLDTSLLGVKITAPEGDTQVITPLLSYGIYYGWNVHSRYTYVNDGLANVLSISQPSSNWYSTNGGWYFTVVQPE